MVKRTPKAPKTEKKVLKGKTGRKTAVRKTIKKEKAVSGNKSATPKFDEYCKTQPWIRSFLTHYKRSYPKQTELVRQDMEILLGKKKDISATDLASAFVARGVQQFAEETRTKAAAEIKTPATGQESAEKKKNTSTEDDINRFASFMDRYPVTRFFMPSLVMLDPEKAESIRKAVEAAEKKKGDALTTEELKECMKQNNAYLHLEIEDEGQDCCCGKDALLDEAEKDMEELIAKLAVAKAGNPENVRDTILLNYFNNHLSEFKSPEELKAALDKVFPDKKPDLVSGTPGFYGPGLMTGWGGVPAGAENLRPMLGAYTNKDTDGLAKIFAEKRKEDEHDPANAEKSRRAGAYIEGLENYAAPGKYGRLPNLGDSITAVREQNSANVLNLMLLEKDIEGLIKAIAPILPEGNYSVAPQLFSNPAAQGDTPALLDLNRHLIDLRSVGNQIDRMRVAMLNIIGKVRL